MQRVLFGAAGAAVFTGAVYGGFRYSAAKREQRGGAGPAAAAGTDPFLAAYARDGDRFVRRRGYAAPCSSCVISEVDAEGGRGDAPANVFDATADDYDKSIDLDELLTGIKWLRSRLCKLAHGRVLEVSAGTGRNFGRYRAPPACSSVTLLDISPRMLDKARSKVGAGEGDADPRDSRGVPFRFVTGSVASIPFQQAAFDTVVDTFGLCSCDDPVAALREMARVCKPEGTILLLEHGDATWRWLSGRLHRSAPKHAERWGCWWDRDIEAIARSCEAVRVESVKRYHFGSTYLIVARPNPAAAEPPSSQGGHGSGLAAGQGRTL